MKINTKVIKKAMGVRFLTQKDLAALAKVSRPTINAVLLKGSCSAQTAAKLVTVLNLDPCEFVEV